MRDLVRKILRLKNPISFKFKAEISDGTGCHSIHLIAHKELESLLIKILRMRAVSSKSRLTLNPAKVAIFFTHNLM